MTERELKANSDEIKVKKEADVMKRFGIPALTIAVGLCLLPGAGRIFAGDKEVTLTGRVRVSKDAGDRDKPREIVSLTVPKENGQDFYFIGVHLDNEDCFNLVRDLDGLDVEVTGTIREGTNILLVKSCKKELLKKYEGKEELPHDLYVTYAKLVDAMKAGDQKKVEEFCVPGKIKITAEPRPQKEVNYGEDINLPFVTKDPAFDKYIRSIGKDSDTDYLIRTDSTAFWFTKAKDGAWKLSRHVDKPIM